MVDADSASNNYIAYLWCIINIIIHINDVANNCQMTYGPYLFNVNVGQGPSLSHKLVFA